MKKRISFMAVAINLVLAFVFGAMVSTAVGVNPIVSSAVVFGLGTGLQFVFPNMIPKGSAMAGVYREIWTGELVESFRTDIRASFLNEIPDQSRYVRASAGGENEVIHLIDVGADPEVLVNNTTYPIGFQDLGEDDISITLDKFDTKATRITEDELYAITYDKIAVANEKHKNAITGTKFKKATHALAPQADSGSTPVIGTSGDTINGKKAATVNDIIDLAGAMTAAGIPDDGNRVLVLNSMHVNNILKEVKNFYRDYANIGAAQQVRALLYGFKTYVYHDTPVYKVADDEKVAFGAVFDSDAHNVSSVAFYAPDMFRAEGSTKMYFDKPDTQNRQTMLNYNHRHIVLPKKERAIAAMVTKNA